MSLRSVNRIRIFRAASSHDFPARRLARHRERGHAELALVADLVPPGRPSAPVVTAILVQASSLQSAWSLSAWMATQASIEATRPCSPTAWKLTRATSRPTWRRCPRSLVVQRQMPHQLRRALVLSQGNHCRHHSRVPPPDSRMHLFVAFARSVYWPLR